MQALVKTPHIEINIKGNYIPDDIINILKNKYGKKLVISKSEDDESTDVFQTEWFKETETKITPGDNIRIYRELHSLTQNDLGKILGGIPRQHISNMEKGLRGISKENAKKLAEYFNIPLNRFI
jgi:DNA-binding XRE family transcriptional regulator